MCYFQPCQVILLLLLLVIHGTLKFENRCVGIENKKGTLRAGADADLIVLNRDGVVLNTWVKGKEVWSRSSS
jgi:N-acetylglucosamine-6-phosphate deacetylase